MKKLFVSFLFVFVSIVSLSQTYEFDVKNYNLYTVSGFSEKDAILKVMNKGNQSLFKLAFTLTDSSELPSNKPKSLFKETN